MPGSQTRKNKARNAATLAALRLNLARHQQFKARRLASKITAANVAKARRTMNAVRRALAKASKNVTMAGPRSTRKRVVGNNTAMATRKSARIATAAANKALKEQKAAVEAAKKAAARKTPAEIMLNALKKKAANKEAAQEAARKLRAAQLEAEEKEESAERAAAEAEKKLNAAANARKAGTPEKALTSAERSALNALASQMGKMRMK